jgi:hypothetical protein
MEGEGVEDDEWADAHEEGAADPVQEAAAPASAARAEEAQAAVSPAVAASDQEPAASPAAGDTSSGNDTLTPTPPVIANTGVGSPQRHLTGRTALVAPELSPASRADEAPEEEAASPMQQEEPASSTRPTRDRRAPNKFSPS